MSCIRKLTTAVTGSSANTYGAKPSTCLRPGINFRIDRPAPNDVIMHADATLALACLGDARYLKNGRWCLTPKERKLLLERIDTTAGGQAGADGTLSKKDFDLFCNSEENRQWVIENLPSSAHGLACLSLMKRAFNNFDKNHDKVLDEAEWNLFMDFLSQLRIRYLQQMALVGFRAYFGRGQKGTDYTSGVDTQCHVRNLVDALQDSTRADMEKNRRFQNTIQFGILVKDWRGWLSDLYYYSANVHPLHGIWGCDANNRLDRTDRLMMEVAVLCYCSWMSVERWHMVHGGNKPPPWLQNDRYFQWGCVTIPGMIIYYILFFLFTTPKCGTVDESVAHSKSIVRAKWVSSIGDCLGNFFVVGLMVAAIIRVLINSDDLPVEIAVNMLMGRVQAYILAWAMMVGIYFNPFVAWGSTMPGTMCLGDFIGLGQWAMEKRKVCLTTLVLPEEAFDLAGTISGTGAEILATGGMEGLGADEVAFMESAIDALEEPQKARAATEPTPLTSDAKENATTEEAPAPEASAPDLQKGLAPDLSDVIIQVEESESRWEFVTLEGRRRRIATI